MFDILFFIEINHFTLTVIRDFVTYRSVVMPSLLNFIATSYNTKLIFFFNLFCLEKHVKLSIVIMSGH